MTLLRFGPAGTRYAIDLRGAPVWRSVSVRVVSTVAAVRDFRGRVHRGCARFAFRHRLTVHQREQGHVPERIDRIDQVCAHSHQPAPLRDQPRLALHWGLRLQVGGRQRCGQPPGRQILVQVAGFELDNMNFAEGPHSVEVAARKGSAFAEVGAQVVDEDAAVDVGDRGRGALQPVRSHYCEHRFDLMAALRLYNTLSRQKEELRPLRDGVIRIYSCGPTVYRFVHIGNLRTFMLPDLLRRTLEYLGYRTEQVMNITDVGHLTDDTFDRGEDKMLVAARLESKSPEDIAAYYTQAFMEDAALVNIRPADHNPRATQYIAQMIELIEKLIAGGHAYEVGGTVYYDIGSFATYGRLSRNTTDKLLAGSRGEVDPRKRHPGDFTLWKAAGEHRVQVWPRLAHRVFRDVDVAARHDIRYPHRWGGQRVSAPRGRARPIRGRHGASGGESVAAWRPVDAGGGKDGQVGGEFLSRHRARGPGFRSPRVSIPRAAGEVPDQAQLQHRGPGGRRSGSRAASTEGGRVVVRR